MLSSCPYLLILVLRWAQHPLGGAKQSVLHQVFPTQLINSAATQKSGGGNAKFRKFVSKVGISINTSGRTKRMGMEIWVQAEL